MCVRVPVLFSFFFFVRVACNRSCKQDGCVLICGGDRSSSFDCNLRNPASLLGLRVSRPNLYTGRRRLLRRGLEVVPFVPAVCTNTRQLISIPGRSCERLLLYFPRAFAPVNSACGRVLLFWKVQARRRCAEIVEGCRIEPPLSAPHLNRGR